MKTLEPLNSEQLAALKFVLEEVNLGESKPSVTIKDLRQIDKIYNVLETSTDNIALEDSDFRYLKNKFDSYTGWNPQARKIVLSVADVLEAVK